MWITSSIFDHNANIKHIVTILEQEEGCTVKYTSLHEGAPEGEGVYLTIYPKLSHNTDSI